ncbi:MAG: hypothetical protein DRP12_03680 [Candidatus Aenigmatarchaeota archaeon]|nr:MAG: hypothetical protein DRP12_03680 [Candidatus Aenigmarchaeota archaeon]
MKILITSSGKSLDSPVSFIFDRALYFVILNREVRFITNLAVRGRESSRETLEIVREENVDVVITGGIKPEDFHFLLKHGITAYQAVPGSVKHNLELYRQGKLKPLKPV